jgi:tRNA uridine 5-carboxymethylaminomethyl modification enzyme
MNSPDFDILVVGAGHAGIEAALACARMGAKTAIFSMKLESIGRMSCNPSVGGPAKGHLAREIDAMGGEIGYAADLTGIHFRMLNKKKGPAVWAPRVQNDRQLYSLIMREHLEMQTGLHIIEAAVTDLKIENGIIIGIVTSLGKCYFGQKVILCSGTFLNGLIHVGAVSYPGGRSGEPASTGLSESLKEAGLKLNRFKTGTPPRVDLRTLNYSHLEEQQGDENPSGFSFYRDVTLTNKVSCYITRTTHLTHQIIRDNIKLSSLYGGFIKGIGPRYCPSIEDKIVKFPDKETHHIFIEPEGTNTHEGYVNGISTSLPPAIQETVVHSIPGLENAEIMRYGYAIEYDYVEPEEILPTLETKKIKGLYLAGQINGTSGYEEAAAQGLMAGINALLSLENKDFLVLSRTDGYIGVLIDDLVTKGTNEPYRMFTSRAEYRLWLRQDNADERLMPIGYKLGLVSEVRWQKFQSVSTIRDREMHRLLTENCTILNDLPEPIKYAVLLKRPEITIDDLKRFGYTTPQDLTPDIATRIELELKYEGYLKRQSEELQRFASAEQMLLPPELDFMQIPSIAWEAREKLSRIKPLNIGQAMRIPGVNYTDISALMIWLRKNKHTDNSIQIKESE